jgi:hypothetical protein
MYAIRGMLWYLLADTLDLVYSLFVHNTPPQWDLCFHHVVLFGFLISTTPEGMLFNNQAFLGALICVRVSGVHSGRAVEHQRTPRNLNSPCVSRQSLSLFLSFSLSVFLSVCLSVCQSVWLSVCLSVCLSVRFS